MSDKLDLMDWKSVERNAKVTIQEHKVSMRISEILLAHAIKEIHALKGKTLDEEEEELKKNQADPYHADNNQ